MALITCWDRKIQQWLDLQSNRTVDAFEAENANTV